MRPRNAPEAGPRRASQTMLKSTTVWECFTPAKRSAAKAAENLENATRLRPAYSDALNNLGVLFVADNSVTRKRKKNSGRASRKRPTFDQAYLNLARLYVVLNDKEKARAVLQALLQKQPLHQMAQQMLRTAILRPSERHVQMFGCELRSGSRTPIAPPALLGILFVSRSLHPVSYPGSRPISSLPIATSLNRASILRRFRKPRD